LGSERPPVNAWGCSMFHFRRRRYTVAVERMAVVKFRGTVAA